MARSPSSLTAVAIGFRVALCVALAAGIGTVTAAAALFVLGVPGFVIAPIIVLASPFAGLLVAQRLFGFRGSERSALMLVSDLAIVGGVLAAWGLGFPMFVDYFFNVPVVTGSAALSTFVAVWVASSWFLLRREPVM